MRKDIYINAHEQIERSLSLVANSYIMRWLLSLLDLPIFWI